ncbi:MAG: alpha/beta fold hydrolase [Bryobacteraceae bacterium]|jgi:S-formylglutathione hydrolase FrmB
MRLGGLVILAALFSAASQPQHGTVERVVVHGKALEGNLEGDSPDRDVAVYLPPSYNTARKLRYPVVYMLHGFTDDVDHWWGVKPHFVNLPAVIDKALAGGKTREMIVVMPNAYTRYQGSMYSTSATTGDWENFVASELVAYVDSHYRTIPGAAGRGLAGHSMGGYGAIRIGMKHPEVFSSVYLLSPCCMAASIQPGGPGMAPAEAIHSPADVEKANFFTKAAIASAAAWSPNPKNPPLYFDLPSKNGEFQPAIAAKWAANAPLAILDQYIPNLKRLHAIAFDAGAQDAAIAATIKVLDGILNAYEIRHTFEIYEGTHLSRIAERIETKTLPFFSTNLSFTQTRR